MNTDRSFNIQGSVGGNLNFGNVGGNISSNVEGDVSTYNQEKSTDRESLTSQQVIELLTYIEDRIQSFEKLPEDIKKKSLMRLENAKVEAEESEPDKNSIATSLKRVNASLNEASQTTKGIKEFVQEVAPTAVQIAKWLGYAAGTIWTILP